MGWTRAAVTATVDITIGQMSLLRSSMKILQEVVDQSESIERQSRKHSETDDAVKSSTLESISAQRLRRP